MKNVLYILSTIQKSGPVNIIINILKEIDRNEYKPIILSLTDENENEFSANNEFKELNIDIHSLKLTRFKGFIFGRSKIYKFCREMKIDTIHLVGFRADLFVSSRKFKDYKIVSSIFSNIFEDYAMHYGKYKGFLMAHLHIKSLKGKEIVACSEFVKNELNKRTDLNFHIIHNGVPKYKFMPPNTDAKISIRNKLNIPTEKKVFIFIGILIKRKDPISAIKGFLNSSISKDGMLLVLGDGPLMEKCKIASKGSKSIIFLGNTKDTISFLQASDYYISTSLSEGLPTSVIEALGCGLPLILSNIAPHMEILNFLKESNYCFPTKDIEMLSQLINKIIKEDYKSLSNKSREVVELKLNSEIMSSLYQSIYSTSK